MEETKRKPREKTPTLYNHIPKLILHPHNAVNGKLSFYTWDLRNLSVIDLGAIS